MRHELNIHWYDSMLIGSLFMYSGSKVPESTCFLNSRTAVLRAAALFAGFRRRLSSRWE